MLRIVVCLGVLFFFCGCEKNWRGLMIEKRVYRDGYYVHLPWKRYTPKNEYPKPEPFPVDHSRTAATDSTQKYAGGLATDSSGTKQTMAGPGSGGGTGNAGGSPAPPPVNSGSGCCPPAPPANGNSPGTAPPSPVNPNPPVAYNPAPPLQQEPVVDPPLYRPDGTPLPTDTSVAVNDTAATPVDSVASNKGFEFPEGELSFVAELGFYNSVGEKSYEVNPQSYNAGGGFRYTTHPWARHKISAEASAFVSDISIAQDQRKRSPLFTEPHGKERIMQLKTRFMLMDHVFITRSASAKIDAIEFGLFSDIGLFSTHVAVDYHGNNNKAALTRSKTRLFGLKYIRTMQFGFTMRVANDKWSAFANYRFNSLLKASPYGGDLPKLVIGVSRNFSD